MESIMESIMENSRLADLMKENLSKQFDQVKLQASSILSFILQWNDLEDHFASMKNSLLIQAQQLALQEKNIAEMKEQLEQSNKEIEIKSRWVEKRLEELPLRENQLEALKISILDCDLELVLKEEQLMAVKEKLKNCNDKFELKGNECQNEHDLKLKDLSEIQKLIDERLKELDLKGKELSGIQQAIDESSKESDSKSQYLESIKMLIEENTEELEAKEKKHDALQIEVWSKEKQLNLVQKELEDHNSRLDTKKEEIARIKRFVADVNEDLCSLEGKLVSKKNYFRKCCQELESVNKSLEENKKELGLKKNELREIEILIEESSKDFDSKRKLLDSSNVLIEEKKRDLEAMDKRHLAIQESINSCSAEFKLKESELVLIDKSAKEYSEKLHEVQMSVEQHEKELQFKKEQINTKIEELKTCCKDIELRKEDFDAILISIADRSEELESKQKQLNSVQVSLEECSKELQAMNEQKESIQKSIMDRSKEYALVDTNLGFARKSLKSCCHEVELKKAQLDSILKTSKFCGDLERKEKYLDSLRNKLEEGLKDLAIRKRDFENHVKEFELRESELKEKQLSSIPQQPKNLTANDLKVFSSLCLKCCIAGNGRELQCLLNDHLAKHDFVCSEVFAAVQKSADPAKLVFDALEGFYPPSSKKGDFEFDLSVVRRSCITLLEQLLNISPHIKRKTIKDAMKLATEWKVKMRAVSENYLEVLGFLWLLAAFDLASAFNVYELQTLLDIIPRGRKATALRQALRIVDDIRGSRIASASIRIEIPEVLQVSDPTYSSSSNFQFSSMIFEENLPSALNENVDNHEFTQCEVSSVIHLSPDPAKFVLNVMQGSYTQLWKNAVNGLDASVIWSSFFLLWELMKVSPKISPLVKEDARKLLILWKDSIRLEAENSMEIMTFLLFLGAYGLVSYFNRDEILRLVLMVAQHKECPDICLALGITDKIPDIIQKLIVRKQHMEAARLCCAFGLVDTFQLGEIFEGYLANAMVDAHGGNNSPEAQRQALDNEMTALRSILDCIEDYKLELRLPTINIKEIRNRVSILEKAKEDGTNPADQPQARGENHHTVTSSCSRNRPTHVAQTQQQSPNLKDQQQLLANKNKRPKLDDR